MRKLDELARLQPTKRGDELRIQRTDRFDRVGGGEQDDYRDRELIQVLLVLESAIVGAHRIEPRLGARRSNSPFSIPDQCMNAAVKHSCPGSSKRS